MKIHTTNYTNTFIAVADDCPATRGEIPPTKRDKKTIANIQFDMISKQPFLYTSDNVLFQVYADRNDLTKEEYIEARAQFFSKGQPCLRASPLTKRYGWEVQSDKDGKIALYGCETIEYENRSKDATLTLVKAMKSH